MSLQKGKGVIVDAQNKINLERRGERNGELARPGEDT